MSTIRINKINTVLQAIVSGYLHSHLVDRGVGMITVTRVETLQDLSSATVFISLFDKTVDQRDVLREIHDLRRDLRRELLSRLSMKKIPTLRFQFDESSEKLERIETLLRQ